MVPWVCEQCAAPLPVKARSVTRHCSPRCRQRAHRSRAHGLPPELVALDRWVTHTRRKVPMMPKGVTARVDNPATWSPFSRVRSLPRRGFVLAADGIVCLDLDHCVADGQLAPWAAEILTQCPDTYVELSLSGTGLHVFGLGTVAVGRKIRDGRNIEIYGTGRYIAVTAKRYGDSPARLADLTAAIASLT